LPICWKSLESIGAFCWEGMMPDNLFDGLGPFADGLSNSERGQRAIWLTKACKNVPDAREATVLLGDPMDASRRDRARQHLNAMPSVPRRQVLATYQRLSKG
jgi:hypothetical protein